MVGGTKLSFPPLKQQTKLLIEYSLTKVLGLEAGVLTPFLSFLLALLLAFLPHHLPLFFFLFFPFLFLWMHSFSLQKSLKAQRDVYMHFVPKKTDKKPFLKENGFQSFSFFVLYTKIEVNSNYHLRLAFLFVS